MRSSSSSTTSTTSIDPWGNCYLVNLAALTASEPTTVWVVSAGPNSIIETPSFAKGSSTPGGNDVAARIR